MMKILVVFGTRPEAIKMCPVVNELKKRKNTETVVCVSAQHREMLDSVLKTFGVIPDFDLDVMRRGQSLSLLTSRILEGVSDVIDKTLPDAVLVHGDTATAFAASLAAFYKGVPTGHVEAGLRTGDIFSPFPEEFNRMAVGLTARWHFAPTQRAKENLLLEGKREECVFVTGNTVVDALKTTVRADFKHWLLEETAGKRLLFLTLHRRESQGEKMRGILRGVKRAVDENRDTALVCPIHKNPLVENEVRGTLLGSERIFLCPPLDTVSCHNILARSHAVLTDSGGIQEEAAALGIPALVLREKTERGEGVETGALRLVGREEERVYKEISRLLTDGEEYKSMLGKKNPYGDGNAAKRICDVMTL